MRRYPPLIAALFAALLLSGSLALAEDSTYSPWQNPNQGGDITQLLKQLRDLIAKAEQAKAADPVFLEDLHKLADSFDNPWPTKVLFDDFRDGDFANNPVWVVSAGNWRIDTQKVGGLLTRVKLQQNASSNQGGSSAQNALVGILGDLLQQQQGGQTEDQSQDQYAGISTAAAIPNSFQIRLEIATRDASGRFDLGPYRGANNDSGYFLTYMPALPKGLTLWSVVSGQSAKQIASSTGPVRLGDSALHAIDWKRDRNGKMTVAVDGKVVMEVTDLSLRKPFEGFVMANSGGSYIVHSVTINGGR